jgi:flagellar biosynthesis/type III secretory pathway chaperone
MNEARLLDALVTVLLTQEEHLGRLLALAEEERSALIHGDYVRVERVSEQMLAAAAEMDRLDADREALVHQLDAGETLAKVEELADMLGVRRLGRARKRLRAQAERLRAAQETNARLILDATRIQERWYGLLTSMGPSTYGARGQQGEKGYGAISKSA